MTPFYFGTQGRRLFGIYEPAAAGTSGRRAALLCSPWGSEYIYAHRSLRQLAIRMSAAGIHTLRFDFFGTGDSAGDMAEADLAGWQHDIELAIEELQAVTGMSRVILAGMRLGATLAASVATRRPSDIEGLVLWNPIISGPAYLENLRNAKASMTLAGETCFIDETWMVRGFPLTPALRQQIDAIELLPVLTDLRTRTLLLMTDHAVTPPGLAGQPLGKIDIALMSGVAPWIEDPENMGVVPVGAVQWIADWLG